MSGAWSELKLAYSSFDCQNCYMLGLLTLGYTSSELAHYSVGPLALPMARDIGFGDYACFEKAGVKHFSCNQYKSNET